MTTPQADGAATPTPVTPSDTELLAWVDGALVPASAAHVSAYDRGFRSGEGVFETLRAYGDHPFRLAAHVDRAVAGAHELGFELDRRQLGAAVAAAARANLPIVAGADTALRLTTSAGPIDPDSLFPGVPTGTPTIVVTSHRLRPPRVGGSSAVTVALTRELPHVKAVSYLVALTARRRARAAGADEALLTTGDGRVLEGSSSNVFAVIAGHLVTPPLREGLLAGVTRSVVLEVATRLGLPVDERPLTVAELAGADEAFLTATTREVIPLTELDHQPVGDGAPGPVTGRVHAGYRDEVARERAAGHGFDR
jgi:branched-subunit amino acid aminotransferase/4-amino-4-deoxychorismate lyase